MGEIQLESQNVDGRTFLGFLVHYDGGSMQSAFKTTNMLFGGGGTVLRKSVISALLTVWI